MKTKPKSDKLLVRMSPRTKKAAQRAADKDERQLSDWIRWLVNRRITEQKEAEA